MNIFNGKLVLQTATPVQGEPTQWDIVAIFSDLSGMYYATDAIVGDIIYNDGSMVGAGILRYELMQVYQETDFASLCARIKWSLVGNEASDPVCELDTMIGRPTLGSVFLPSSTVQGLGESFIQYARNVESWLAAKYSYINRIYNAEFIGERNSDNRLFIPLEPFIVETLKLKWNGAEQVRGQDFNVLEDGSILTEFTPSEEDTLVLDFNKV